MKRLFELLVQHGGKIVSSNDLSPDCIAQARASNRMYVDENFLGYVWEPPFSGFLPVTDKEIEMFEWCYPIHPDLPESLKSPDFLFKKKKKSILPKTAILTDYSKVVYGHCKHGNNMANCMDCESLLLKAIFGDKKKM